MISDKAFLEMLHDKTLGLSKEALEQTIENELEKSENEMDADLIEFCLDALNELNSNNDVGNNIIKAGDTNEKVKLKGFKKVVALVATLALVLAGSFSVSALVFDGNIFGGLVEFYNDYIRIRFDKDNDNAGEYKLLGSNLAKELAENGISPVLLPEAILTDKYEITSVEYEKLVGVTAVNISYLYKNKKGNIFIQKYEINDAVPYTDYLDCGEKFETIDLSGITAYIFEQNKKGTIAYQDNSICYTIQLPLSFYEAVELAKTIK